MSMAANTRTRAETSGDAARKLVSATRWRGYEFAFWLVAIALYFIFGNYIPGMPTRLMLLTEIVTLGLLALSIDLVLGYAGIVTLGQGAFFGLGAYVAGLMAKWGAGVFPLADPLIGLLAAALLTGLVGFASGYAAMKEFHFWTM